MDRRTVLHLFGAAVALPAFDLAALRRRALRTLDPHQDATVTAVAELILPATDTPGAKDAGVTQFIDVLLSDWMTGEARDRFLAGVKDLVARARAAFGKDFVDGAPADQVRLLTLMEDEALRIKDQPDSHPEPFFRTMKRLTMYGYYTSKVGAEQDQHFEMIPGGYQGCVPLRGATGGED
jgi:hypothetical protein